MPRWIRVTGGVAYTLVAALVLCELLLRLASVFVAGRGSTQEDVHETVLSVGDSHTYGLYFDAEDSYPGRLASVLDDRAAGRYRVVNLGLPGTNSSEVVTRLPDWLAQAQRPVVVVGVGMNNGWNRSQTSEAGERGPARHFFDGLRIVRLVRLTRSNLDVPAPEPDQERPDIERVVLGEGTVDVEHRDAVTGEVLIRHTGNFFDLLPVADQRALLRRDLATILGLTRSRDARLVLLTYGVFPLDSELDPSQRTLIAVNEEIRAFAAANAVRLVDVSARFDALMRSGVGADELFHADERHPSRRGYREIANLVADVIEP